ncbi:Hypothetical protein Bdt_1641 [Bdellovibrio bacteriovorus str. Tiberius]|uniref:Uncharacterized protein n=1 Tax=Bdellovibrio bacteriovorus str. Tiberius TaxID=1069642 RepID=K7YND7_BDEBC|nr:Hypothetical protein Bdt_1641 [Bdellovibrio bacteriovorus str. Tiberius]
MHKRPRLYLSFNQERVLYLQNTQGVPFYAIHSDAGNLFFGHSRQCLGPGRQSAGAIWRHS